MWFVALVSQIRRLGSWSSLSPRWANTFASHRVTRPPGDVGEDVATAGEKSRVWGRTLRTSRASYCWAAATTFAYFFLGPDGQSRAQWPIFQHFRHWSLPTLPMLLPGPEDDDKHASPSRPLPRPPFLPWHPDPPPELPLVFFSASRCFYFAS